MAPLTIPIAGSSPRILPSRSSFPPIQTLNNANHPPELYHLRASPSLLIKSHHYFLHLYLLLSYQDLWTFAYSWRNAGIRCEYLSCNFLTSFMNLSSSGTVSVELNKVMQLSKLRDKSWSKTKPINIPFFFISNSVVLHWKVLSSAMATK